MGTTNVTFGKTARAAAAPTDGASASPHLGVGVADIAFTALVLGTVFTFLIATNDYGFRADDWRLAARGNTFGDYFQPYNDHLSVVPIAVYRLVYEGFGFGTALPLRIIGMTAAAGIAIAMYVVVRARVGPALALLAGAAMLWYPDVNLTPAAFNHWLAITGAIVCAGLLTGTGRDVAIALVLAVALASSGVGVAAAVGCAVFVVLSGAPMRRWIAVGVPSLAWLTWWLIVPEHRNSGRSLEELARPVWDGVVNSFAGLAFGNRLVGIVLLVAFVALLAHRLRRGLRQCANEIAWTVALLSWWIALAISRFGSVSDEVRYTIVGSAFVILAALPTRPVGDRARLATPAFLGAAMVGCVALVAVNQGGIFDNVRAVEIEQRRVREGLIVANLGPDVVPDDTRVFVGGIAALTAGEYRDLAERWGRPFATDPDDPDAEVVRLRGIRPLPLGDDAPVPGCSEATGAMPLPPEAHVVLRAPDDAVDIGVRRFSDAPVDLGEIPAGSAVTLRLPSLRATTGWTIDAPGACIDPAMKIQSPEDGATVRRTIALIALPNTTDPVGEVTFRAEPNDGASEATIVAASPTLLGWIAPWDTATAPNGRYTLTAVVTTPDGDVVESRPIAIRVDN